MFQAGDAVAGEVFRRVTCGGRSQQRVRRISFGFFPDRVVIALLVDRLRGGTLIRSINAGIDLNCAYWAAGFFDSSNLVFAIHGTQGFRKALWPLLTSGSTRSCGLRSRIVSRHGPRIRERQPRLRRRWKQQAGNRRGGWHEGHPGLRTRIHSAT